MLTRQSPNRALTLGVCMLSEDHIASNVICQYLFQEFTIHVKLENFDLKNQNYLAHIIIIPVTLLLRQHLIPG